MGDQQQVIGRSWPKLFVPEDDMLLGVEQRDTVRIESFERFLIRNDFVPVAVVVGHVDQSVSVPVQFPVVLIHNQSGRMTHIVLAPRQVRPATSVPERSA